MRMTLDFMRKNKIFHAVLGCLIFLLCTASSCNDVQFPVHASLPNVTPAEHAYNVLHERLKTTACAEQKLSELEQHKHAFIHAINSLSLASENAKKLNYSFDHISSNFQEKLFNGDVDKMTSELAYLLDDLSGQDDILEKQVSLIKRWSSDDTSKLNDFLVDAVVDNEVRKELLGWKTFSEQSTLAWLGMKVWRVTPNPVFKSFANWGIWFRKKILAEIEEIKACTADLSACVWSAPKPDSTSDSKPDVAPTPTDVLSNAFEQLLNNGFYDEATELETLLNKYFGALNKTKIPTLIQAYQEAPKLETSSINSLLDIVKPLFETKDEKGLPILSETPLRTLTRISYNLYSLQSKNQCQVTAVKEWTLQDAKNNLQEAAQFLRDGEEGMPAILEIAKRVLPKSSKQ